VELKGKIYGTDTSRYACANILPQSKPQTSIVEFVLTTIVVLVILVVLVDFVDMMPFILEILFAFASIETLPANSPPSAVHGGCGGTSHRQRTRLVGDSVRRP
jgi:hypothetical protein